MTFLKKNFPANSVDYVIEYIEKFNIHLKITRKRIYKLGDYKPPNQKIPAHRISINNNLNPYTTLLIFLHELSHLLVWVNYKKKVKPHGKEWKNTYGNLLSNFIEKNIFPDVLKKVLEKKLFNSKASLSSDAELFHTLALYDEESSKPVLLEEIPGKTRFIAHNGKTFIKQNKRRKRFCCFCLDNNKFYLFHPLTNIKPLER